jgi:hypothetical protein
MLIEQPSSPIWTRQRDDQPRRIAGGRGRRRVVVVDSRLDVQKRRRSVHRTGAQYFESALVRRHKEGGAFGCLLDGRTCCRRHSCPPTKHWTLHRSEKRLGRLPRRLAGYLRPSIPPRTGRGSKLTTLSGSLRFQSMWQFGALGRKMRALGPGASRKANKRTPEGGELS